jgi:hypothetical protein
MATSLCQLYGAVVMHERVRNMLRKPCTFSLDLVIHYALLLQYQKSRSVSNPELKLFLV